MTSCNRRLTYFATVVTDGIWRPSRLQPHEYTLTGTLKSENCLWRVSPSLYIALVFGGTDLSFAKLLIKGCTDRFNIKQFYVMPTQRIDVFCVDLRTNSDYFPIQH